MEAIDEPRFKSPPKKLIAFFERSRDGWKAKYFRKRDENILLANKVRAVEKSRLHWREIAQQAQHENKQAQAELRQLGEQLKKTNPLNPVS